MQEKISAFKNKIFLFSFGLGIASTVAICTPNGTAKDAGKFALGFSIAGVVLGELVTGKAINEANHAGIKAEQELKSKTSEYAHLTKKSEQEIKVKLAEIANLTRDIDRLGIELKTTKANLERFEKEVHSGKEIIESRTNQLNLANTSIADLKIKLQEVGQFSTHQAYEIVKNTYSRSVKKLEHQLDALSRNYPACDEELQPIYIEVDKLQRRYLDKLREYEALTDFKDLLDIGLDIQEKVINGCIELRVKAQTIVIRYLDSIVNDSVPFDSYEEHISNLANAAGEQIKQAQAQREADVKAIASEWVVSNQGWEHRYNNNFEEILQAAKEAIARLQEREAQLEQLQQALTEAQKPHLLPGQSEQARIANAIASYYFNLGYTLDSLDWQQVDTGYKLTFSSSRNGQRFINSEMLNDKEMGLPEKLKELSSALNLPKFERSERGGHWEVDIQKWHLQKKKSSEQDISRLWVPASKFETTVKGWSRVRITGGSESGKSPTAENLAVCILKNRAGTAKLFNPQHDSVKNYWTIPVEGTSHKDSEKGIAALAKLVDARSTGQESRDAFELCLFDEIDSTMSHTKGKKSAIGSDVNFIIKQASHQNLGAIFIGQNANVSEYPGMDRSDWNSAVNVHIGANAYDAITNSNLFTTDEITRLKSTADKLSEFCSTKNDELGLDKTDPNSYRFALVVEPNKKPYFLELPSFGIYTYNDLVVVGSAGNTSGNPTGSLGTFPDQTLEPLSTKAGKIREIPREPGICPHCGNPTDKVKDRTEKSIRYQCLNLECKKSFTVKLTNTAEK